MRPPKYRNLAPKILDVLGQTNKTHKDLADLCGVQRTTVTMWLRKERPTAPKDEHLIQIAKLMKDRAWWYLAWFLDDEVEAGRGVDYDNKGHRTALEPIWPEEAMEEMAAAWAAEQEQTQSPPKAGPVAEALSAEGPVDLTFLREALINSGDPAALESAANTPEAAETKPQNLNPDTEVKNALVHGSGLGWLSTPSVQGGLGALAEHLLHQDERAWQIASKPFVDSANGKLVSLMPRAMYGLERVIEKGSLRHYPNYFDNSCLIEIVVARARFKSFRLLEGIGKLLVMEKMHGRSLSKMLAVCIDLKNPNQNPKLLADALAARGLGVEVEFFSPDEDDKLARLMGAFILRNSPEIKEIKSEIKAIENRIIDISNTPIGAPLPIAEFEEEPDFTLLKIKIYRDRLDAMSLEWDQKAPLLNRLTSAEMNITNAMRERRRSPRFNQKPT